MKRLFFGKKQTIIQLQQTPMPSLATCLMMDLLGYVSYGIPFLGEFIDIIWAPISAIIFMKLFGFKKGFLGGVFNFVEELMPGLDFIPTFTITWMIHYFKRNKANYLIQPATR